MNCKEEENDGRQLRVWHLRVGRQPTAVRPKGVGLAAAHVVGVEVAPRVVAHQARPLKHTARDVRAAVLAYLLTTPSGSLDLLRVCVEGANDEI